MPTIWWKLNDVRPQRGLPGRLESGAASPRLVGTPWPKVGDFAEPAEHIFPQLQDVITATELSLYAGPGSSYPEVLRLTPRVPVKVHACMPDYAWCEVSYGNDRGWADELAAAKAFVDAGAAHADAGS